MPGRDGAYQDLPKWLVSVARKVARVCRSDGEWLVVIRRAGGRPREVWIKRVEAAGPPMQFLDARTGLYIEAAEGGEEEVGRDA